MNLSMRPATDEDCDAIVDLHLQAFPEEERHLIANLAADLLHCGSNPASLAFVAQSDSEIVGHIAFSPVYASDSGKCPGFILSPLAVLPACHNAGIGSKLVRHGMSRLSELGTGNFFVYGDPGFYGRFGFEANAALRFVPPYDLSYPFGWLAIVRNPPLPGEPTVQLSCVEPLCNPVLW